MHWIYLIHEFHNLSWITEINELFQGREGVQLPDSLMYEAVLQSAGPRLETPQSPPWWQQTEEAVCRVGGITCNAEGFAGETGAANVLEGGERDTNDLLSCSQLLCPFTRQFMLCFPVWLSFIKQRSFDSPQVSCVLPATQPMTSSVFSKIKCLCVWHLS